MVTGRSRQTHGQRPRSESLLSRVSGQGARRGYTGGTPTALSRSITAERLEEVREGYPEGIGELAEGGDADVSLPTFDAADIVPVQIGPLRQLLLRNLPLQAQLSNPLSNCSRKAPPHPAMLSA